jgi:hypothetical protein
MKFTPEPSTSPRVVRSASAGDVELKIIFDPKDSRRYLAVGVGSKTVRRVWLSPEQATELLVTLATLSPEWSK